MTIDIEIVSVLDETGYKDERARAEFGLSLVVSPFAGDPGNERGEKPRHLFSNPTVQFSENSLARGVGVKDNAVVADADYGVCILRGEPAKSFYLCCGQAFFALPSNRLVLSGFEHVCIVYKPRLICTHS